MKCPVCEDVTLSISSREGVEIDHCPQCRGVWLDRGELDKIIDRAAPSLVAAAPMRDERDREWRPERPDARYDDGRDRYRDDDRSYKRRKRSFLDDIFDFD